MSRLIRYFLFLFLMVFAVVLISCEGVQEHPNSVGDTEVGQTDSGDTGIEILSETQQVLSSLCSLVDNCFTGSDNTACLEALQADENLLDAFGAADSFVSFTQVQAAIETESISVSSEDLTSCDNAIDQVSCDAAEQADLFDSGAPADYSQVFRGVPSECNTLFSSN